MEETKKTEKVDTLEKVQKFFEDCKAIINKEKTLEETIEECDLTIANYIPFNVKMAIASLVNNIVTSKITNARTTEIQNYLKNGYNNYDSVMFEAVNSYNIVKHIFIIGQYLNMSFAFTEQKSETLDLLIQSGVVDYIKSHTVNKDYDEFEKVIDDYTGLRYFGLAEMVASVFDDMPTQEKMIEVKKALDDLDKSKIEDLKGILEMNDPMTANVVKMLQKTTAEEIMQKDKGKNNGEIVIEE